MLFNSPLVSPAPELSKRQNDLAVLELIERKNKSQFCFRGSNPHAMVHATVGTMLSADFLGSSIPDNAAVADEFRALCQTVMGQPNWILVCVEVRVHPRGRACSWSRTTARRHQLDSLCARMVVGPRCGRRRCICEC